MSPMKRALSNYIFDLDENAVIPKYQQLVECVVEGIRNRQLDYGEQIPSINEVRKKCKLSRDTVERAYNILKQERIIISKKGKGNYINKTRRNSRGNILFLLNKLSPYKMLIHNAFVGEMGDEIKVDLKLYHGDNHLFLKILKGNIEVYDRFVVVPFFGNDLTEAEEREIVRTLEQIGERLVIVDNHLSTLNDNIPSVFQDFKSDIFESLKEGIQLLKKYNKIILVVPDRKINPYPNAIKEGFAIFCKEFDFDFEIMDTIYPDMELSWKDIYILVEESDLIHLLQQVKAKNLKPGTDLGIISYNDTPLKELLGITVMSTDFQAMGETAAYMIRRKKNENVKNAFHFINRSSL